MTILKATFASFLLFFALNSCLAQSKTDSTSQKAQLTAIQQAQIDLNSLGSMAKDSSFNLVNVVALSSWTKYKLECLRDTSVICVDVFKFPNKDHEQLVGCKPEYRQMNGWIETRSIYVTRKPELEEFIQWLVNGLRK